MSELVGRELGFQKHQVTESEKKIRIERFRKNHVTKNANNRAFSLKLEASRNKNENIPKSRTVGMLVSLEAFLERKLLN